MNTIRNQQETPRTPSPISSAKLCPPLRLRVCPRTNPDGNQFDTHAITAPTGGQKGRMETRTRQIWLRSTVQSTDRTSLGVHPPISRAKEPSGLQFHPPFPPFALLKLSEIGVPVGLRFWTLDLGLWTSPLFQPIRGDIDLSRKAAPQNMKNYQTNPFQKFRNTHKQRRFQRIIPYLKPKTNPFSPAKPIPQPN